MRIKISARQSDLARLQAYTVGEALQKQHPHLHIEYKFKESLGDKNLTDALWKMPEKGVFTEDFYGELLRGETDLVVHSWKDLPVEFKPETHIAATLPRADQRDLLLFKKKHREKSQSLKVLKVFSSSPRREYNLTEFLKNYIPWDLSAVSFENVRGNIPTRIRKLIESSEVDGLIVAKAALDRLLAATQSEFAPVQDTLRGYLTELDWMVLPLSVNPNAAAQGALAIETLKSRPDLQELLAPIHDAETFACAEKERQILSQFGGGCHQKIGVAVLHRPYGEITFLRGLTDTGVILDKQELAKPLELSKLPGNSMAVPEIKVERQELPTTKLNQKWNAFFVARKEAWTSAVPRDALVWTAGLETWKQLAQQGVWVQGCSESLGEHEDPRIEVLAQKALSWVKLSHDQGYEEGHPLHPIYHLEYVGALALDLSKESFYWMSGSLFLQALKMNPEIASKRHACGPGNTAKIIRAELERRHQFDSSRFDIFLNQEDWRKQCTR